MKMFKVLSRCCFRLNPQNQLCSNRKCLKVPFGERGKEDGGKAMGKKFGCAFEKEGLFAGG